MKKNKEDTPAGPRTTAYTRGPPRAGPPRRGILERPEVPGARGGAPIGRLESSLCSRPPRGGCCRGRIRLASAASAGVVEGRPSASGRGDRPHSRGTPSLRLSGVESASLLAKLRRFSSQSGDPRASWSADGRRPLPDPERTGSRVGSGHFQSERRASRPARPGAHQRVCAHGSFRPFSAATAFCDAVPRGSPWGRAGQG